MKSILPRLVPFFKTVCIYFVVSLPAENPTVFAALLKCLPIVSLMLFVVLYGGVSWGQRHYYTRQILAALAASCLGDALLVWPAFFPAGMLSFTVSHLFYITAFGWVPFKRWLGAFFYALAFFGWNYMSTGFDPVMRYAVPIYSLLLSTTVWRTAARVPLFEKASGPAKTSWSKWCTFIGALLFAVSDFLIGVDRFLHPVENGQTLIMATYYAGQLGLSLSIVDTMAPQIKQN